jgi:hypothetical protein
MTPSLFLANVTAYSAQILIVVAVGGALGTLLRRARPIVRYTIWQLLLLLCLTLPFLSGPSRLASRFHEHRGTAHVRDDRCGGAGGFEAGSGP